MDTFRSGRILATYMHSPRGCRLTGRKSGRHFGSDMRGEKQARRATTITGLLRRAIKMRLSRAYEGVSECSDVEAFLCNVGCLSKPPCFIDLLLDFLRDITGQSETGGLCVLLFNFLYAVSFGNGRHLPCALTNCFHYLLFFTTAKVPNIIAL